jgi:hypothetical protein
MFPRWHIPFPNYEYFARRKTWYTAHMPRPHRALACAAAMSLVLLVGLSVLWVRSSERSWTVTYFGWNYRGDLQKSTSTDAIFRVSGGEIGLQAVRFYGPFQTHQRYYWRLGTDHSRWRSRVDPENCVALTETHGWPRSYGFRHNGDSTSGFSQTWGFVLPIWGAWVVLALCPATWAFLVVSLHLRPKVRYTSAPSISTAAPVAAASSSAGMPQNHAR